MEKHKSSKYFFSLNNINLFIEMNNKLLLTEFCELKKNYLSIIKNIKFRFVC
jgi:hypothetical protein